MQQKFLHEMNTGNIRELRLSYFNETDFPWVDRLIDEHKRFVGKTRRAALTYFKEPLSFSCPKVKLRTICKTIGDNWPVFSPLKLNFRKLRHEIFAAAGQSLKNTPSSSRWTNDALIIEAERLSLNVEDVPKILFSDLADEKIFTPWSEDLSSRKLCLLANRSLLQSHLAKAKYITLNLKGHARAVVRQARLHGLLCNISSHSDAFSNMEIFVSGPLALFRHTRLYAKALTSLLPILAWCHRFSMKIVCQKNADLYCLVVKSNDPIFPGEKPKMFDSAIERRFFDDFSKAAPDYEIVKEPEPIQAGSSLIFPDFRITHKRNLERTWIIEIVGFWTPEYLQSKFSRLKAAGITNLIVAIDEKLFCGQRHDLQLDWLVVTYKKKIDVKKILFLITS